MAQEIEIEFKNLLTKKEFDDLMQAFDFPAEKTVQENFYFETEDFQLREHASALRIREKKSNYVLTLKEPHEEGLLETHDILTDKEAHAWISGKIIPKEYTDKQLKQLGVASQELIYFGSLKTERRTINYENTQLVLDYSQYNNQADFELELEAESYAEGEAVFQEILEKYQIPQRDTPTKIERFFLSQP